MNYNNDVRSHITSLEHSKFIEIQDTRYPAVSVTRVQYPESSSMIPVSTTEIYPKHAVLTYLANPEDISISITGGGTVGGGKTDTLLDVLSSQVKTLIALSNTLTARSEGKTSSWSTVSASVTNLPTTFASTPATLVSILNNTGVTILIQNANSLPAFPLPYGGSIEIYTVANANEITLKREDGDTNPVEVFGVVTRRV